MRHGLGDLGLRQAIVHPDGDVARELRHLTIGDQCADGDEAAVARGEIGTQPQIAEQNVGRVLSPHRRRGPKPAPRCTLEPDARLCCDTRGGHDSVREE